MHVDAHRVHRRKPFLDRRLVARRDVVFRRTFDRRLDALRILPHQRDGVAEKAMRVHVDRLDTPTVDDDGFALAAKIGVLVRPLCIGGVEQAAGAKHQTGCGSTSEELSASGHRVPQRQSEER